MEKRSGDTMERDDGISRNPAIAYIVIVALVCLAPSIGLLFGGGEVSSDADAAPAPTLTNEDGSFNVGVMQEAGNWFDDHFAFRNEWVTAAAVVEGLFGVSTNESVVVGTDGWLYYGDSVDDFRGINQLNDRALYDIAHSMKLVQTYALGRGTSFAFTIAPNKNTLYGGHMPYYYQIRAGETNLDRIAAFLEDEGVNYVDARTLFEGRNDVLYHKRDSHWNNEGAAMVSDALMTALDHEHRSYEGEAHSTRIDFVGDLDKMLSPSMPTPDAEVYYDEAPAFSYVTEDVQSNFDPKIVTSSDVATGGSLVMYRDSFCNSLLPFMAEAYTQAYFSRGVPYQLVVDLDAHEADALVIERAQRFMRDMAANPPVMPAPLVLDESVKEQADFKAVQDVQEREQGDYLLVSGEIDGDIEAGERIAVRLNGSLVYEAFGKCDAVTGREGFQLLVPQSIASADANRYELAVW